MPNYENSSQATSEDREATASNFAFQLLSSEWVLGKCDNQLLMLYVSQQNKVR